MSTKAKTFRNNFMYSPISSPPLSEEWRQDWLGAKLLYNRKSVCAIYKNKKKYDIFITKTLQKLKTL